MDASRVRTKGWGIVCFLALCVAMVTALFPSVAFADEPTTMTAGDVIAEFVPAGTVCESADPSVAWVDEAGSLNALRPGTTTISDGEQTCEVQVGAYSDGSPIVGNLKILARYNDAMQFYDGHVYLLFTSYQDGVTVGVSDLYGAYRISDHYYADINESIANGSNHTGSDADKYFTFTNDTNTMTLNRGQIVTVGMYRGFDLSIPQAAIGCIQNSTLWTGLTDAVKTDIIETVFKFLNDGSLSTEGAFARVKEIATAEGLDYTQLLDGVVEGGVCLNRELYNQKLEWDQYENVTYDLDITQNQLNMLFAYLNGNLNNFSILKNSCATVALRGWNAAVGTRNGVDTAYKLSATGEGIFSIVDAPKTVRDAIVHRLPGHCLNNSAGVAEPDAGYEDETGWVYVSAPKKVNPVNYTYEDDSIQIDAAKTDMASLVNAAKAGSAVAYGKDGQEIKVNVAATAIQDATSISAVEFGINGNVFSLTADTSLEDGIWFRVKVGDAQEGQSYFVTDARGKALPSEYADGWIAFHADALPVAYRIEGGDEGTLNTIATTVVKPDEAGVNTEVYCYNGDQKVVLGAEEELRSGTKFFVKTTYAGLEYKHLLTDITLNGASILDTEHYDATEGAYAATMPESYCDLAVTYGAGSVKAKKGSMAQVAVGTKLSVYDYAELLVGEDQTPSDKLSWRFVLENADVAEFTDESHREIVTTGPGFVTAFACADTNEAMGVLLGIEVYEDEADMAAISYNDGPFTVFWKVGDEEEHEHQGSGYKVPKGSVVRVEPTQTDGTVVSALSYNGQNVKPGETITANEDITISVGFREAAIKDVPSSIRLASKGDTYKLNAEVRYKGLLYQFLPVYDSGIVYESADPLVEVGEDGTIKIVGDIPAEGKAVVITAYAGSSNRSVKAACKVIVGKYQGAEVVGRLTIWARPVVKTQLVAHGAVSFVAYRDTDLNVSYHNYYKPSQSYVDLMKDAIQNPDTYACDPALYSDNELGIEDRESYFEELHNGAKSEPQTISLKSGEGITLSNYGYDGSNLATVTRAIENSPLSASPYVQAFLEQVHAYMDGREIDGPVAFDSMLATLVQMYAMTQAMGSNPANTPSVGGMDVNREVYNQFRRDDSQLPNNFYTVEITADELANLQAYVANPENNYYSLFVKNCSTGSVDIWNATLGDRPELQLTANMTGFATDPQSLNLAIGELWLKTCKTYEAGVAGKEEGGGQDFIPHVVNATGFLFPDVFDTTPHKDDIYWLANNGISTGFPDGTFRPMGTVVRCDMAAFLFRMAKLWGMVDDSWQPSEEQKTAFSDVDESTAHYREVLWLAASGISRGYPDGTFRPMGAVVRQDMAAFLFRLAKLAGKGGAADGWQPTNEQKAAFSDVDENTAHYREVLWLGASGVSTGFPDGTFRPKNTVVRQDMAAFLHRLNDLK